MRARRSCLSVPATRADFHSKAAGSAADEVFFDLEDSVAPEHKERARGMAATAIREYDFGSKVVGVRVNACDTKWCFGDVIEVVEEAGDRLDVLVLPKVESPAHVHFLDLLLDQVEAKIGRRRPVGLELQIESALGMENAGVIATASPRNETLIFGPGDYAASMGFTDLTVGGLREGYPGDFWHHHLVRVAIAARAAGLQPIDGPSGRIRDLAGLRESARRASLLGYDGKWALSPAQIEVINEAFSPSPEELRRAIAILDAHQAAIRSGTGAVMLGDEMIDEASRRMAEVVAAKARTFGLA